MGGRQQANSWPGLSHPLRKSITATSQQKTAGVVTAPIHHLSACGAWERRANEPSEVSQIEFVSKAFLCTEKKKKKKHLVWCFPGKQKDTEIQLYAREKQG